MKVSHRHRLAKSERPIPWWLQQVRERPLATAGTVVSVAGGILLLFFFCQLGEMPELDLAGASAILMAVAAVGFVLAVALTGCAIGAGLILRGDGSNAKELRSAKAMIFLALPGWLSAVVFSFYFAIKPDGVIPNWAYSLPFIFMAALAYVYAFLQQNTSLADNVNVKGVWAKVGRGISFLAISYFWLLIAGSAFLTLVAIYPRDGDASRFLFDLFLWTTWCYLSNIVLVKATEVNTLALVSGCCAVSLVVLLLISGNSAGLPMTVVRVLGLGEIPVVLVLTSDGCDHLNKAAGGRPVCRVETGEKTAIVCPAVMRSRIGSPLFIELSPYDEKGYWPQPHPATRLAAIAISKSEVASWSRLAPMARASAPGSRTSDAVVTYLDHSDAKSWIYQQCGVSPVFTQPNSVPPVQPTSVQKAPA